MFSSLPIKMCTHLLITVGMYNKDRGYILLPVILHKNNARKYIYIKESLMSKHVKEIYS